MNFLEVGAVDSSPFITPTYQQIKQLPYKILHAHRAELFFSAVLELLPVSEAAADCKDDSLESTVLELLQSLMFFLSNRKNTVPFKLIFILIFF